MTRPTEVFNIAELASLAETAPYAADHNQLLAALNSRYPNTPFRLIAERSGRSWGVGIIDQAGNRVTDRLGAWIDQELLTAGGDADAVWRRHKDSGLIRTEWVGDVLYLVSSFGPDPDAFFQLEILIGSEVATQRMFDPGAMCPPEDRQDLLCGPSLIFGDNERQVLSPHRYTFGKLTNIRRYLRELVEVERANRLAELPQMEQKSIRVQEIVLGSRGGSSETVEIPFLDMVPGWLDRVPHGLRLFQDWAESSAGRTGGRFCDHWFLTLNEWRDKNNRHLSLIPQWADADCAVLDLPKIEPDWSASPYGVMEAAQQFDRAAGYPMAWFFYMLHGNRVGHSAGGILANAIKDGLFHLPESDEKVVLRWRNEQYGF
jgi:hypothetical protein